MFEVDCNMTERRFFIEGTIDTTATIDGDEFNHLRNVLRLKVGDDVTLVCGDGFDYHGTISTITKNQAIVDIHDKVANDKDAKVDVTLYLGLVKNDSFSSIITKMSELGVKRIIPFKCQYTDVKTTDVKQEKLQKVANMAIKQCDRSIPLEVCSVTSFETMLKELKEYEEVYFAYEAENTFCKIEPKGQKIAIVVGPIGGFSKEEANKIGKVSKTVTLGKRVLRVETACVSLVSVVMYKSGEWNIG